MASLPISQVKTPATTGSKDLLVEVKRSISFEIEAILYERTAIGGVLDVNVFLDYRGRSYLIRQLPSFSDPFWFFNPETTFPPEAKIRFETSGASGAEDHSVLIIVKE